MDDRKLRELIVLFLEVNPEPSDEQVHAMACAVGIDKETFEAEIYSMMGEIVADDDHLVEVDAAEEEVVNDPLIDPDTMSNSDVAMNDGDPTNDDLGFQAETNDDGATADDEGVGMNNGDVDVLTDDGVPQPPEV